MNRRRRLDARDYTVGWICALPIELAAAQEMLDERDETIPDSLDPIIYTLGRIDVHNVVLACLPAGNTGTQSAATVAARMRTRFTSIRFGLMVGIGGGVPTTDLDIRLGDVVISQPHQQHGGVVQYDFGKTEAGGNTIRTGWLNAPPPVLLSAVVEQRARHMRQESALKTYLSQFERLENFSRHAAGDDVLFEATYDHVGKSTCEACSDKMIVRRRSLNRRLGVGLHYGTIASGNQVMKDGVTRDKISKELGGVMCFEMEAAGLMNDFPCLVLRGICDYADSHKNKQWQPYAAATAAACAKEILSIVPGVPNVSFNKTASASETVQDRIESKLDQIFQELRLGFKPSAMFAQDLEKQLVDDDITEVDVEENKDFIKDWVEHTQERKWFGNTEQSDQSSNADSNDLGYKSEQDGHDIYSGPRSGPRIQEWMASTREQNPVDESEQADQPAKACSSNSNCGSQQDTLDGDTAGFYIDVDRIIYKAEVQSENTAKEKGVPHDEGDGSNFLNSESIFPEFLRGQEQDDARRVAADARGQAKSRQSYEDSEYDRHERHYRHNDDDRQYERVKRDRQHNPWEKEGYPSWYLRGTEPEYLAGRKSTGNLSTEGAGPSILEPSDQSDNEDEESSEGSSPSPPVFRRSTTIPAPVYSPSQADKANKYRPPRHDHGYTGHSDRKLNGREYLDPSQPSNVPPLPNEYVPIYEPETKTRTHTYKPETRSKHKYASMHEPGPKTRTYTYKPGTRSKPGYVSIDEPETKTRTYTYTPGERNTSKYVSVSELGTTTRPYPYTPETRSTSAPIPIYDLFPHSNTVRHPLLLTLEEIFHGTTKKVVIPRRYLRASGEVVRRHVVEVDIKKGFGSNAIVDIPLEIPRVGNRSGERILYDDVRMVLGEKLHPELTRDGDDLHHTLEINVMQSLCGWARVVRTIDGKQLQVRDDGPTPLDWERSFPNNGMPRSTNPKERGNLVVHVKVLQPKHLTEHQKNALRVALADVEY